MGDIRIGTSGWHYASWRGPFYPAGTRPADFLSFYIERFSTVEINNSFYRLPSEAALASWRDSAPEDFLFAWKAHRVITHFKRLKNTEENLAFVFARMTGLAPKCGPVLFQVTPKLTADRERLAAFLTALPQGFSYAVEFRHSSWYEPPILNLLAEHDVSLCLSDHHHAPAPPRATAHHVYVRLHGPGGRYVGHYDDNALREWAARIAGWSAQGRSVACYFDNDQKSAAPADAERLQNFVSALTP